MVVLELPTGGLARVRFGASTLTEITASLWTLARPGRPPWIRRWWHDVRPGLPVQGLRLLQELAPSTGPVCIPEFVMPVPSPGPLELERELDVLLAQPAELVRTELRRALEGLPVNNIPGAPRPLTRHIVESRGEDGYLSLLADQLHRYWTVAIEPYWPRLKAGLDRELELQGRDLAATGLGAVLARLHHQLAYRNDRLLLEGSMRDLRTADSGVVFTASVFMNDWLLQGRNSHDVDQVFYPVRGVGAVWQPEPGRTAARGPAGLLGPVREALLADLETARTTAELATRHAFSASTVSYHLGVLYRAGLVTRSREGRHVLYRRTATGDALLR